MASRMFFFFVVTLWYQEFSRLSFAWSVGVLSGRRQAGDHGTAARQSAKWRRSPGAAGTGLAGRYSMSPLRPSELSFHFVLSSMLSLIYYTYKGS